MKSSGETLREQADIQMTEGRKMLDVIRSRPSLLSEKMNEVLSRIPADGDKAGKEAFNFGLLRRDLEDILASVRGSTDASIVLASCAITAGHVYQMGALLADLAEAQVGMDAMRQARKKREERSETARAINFALAKGDFEEYDRVVTEHYKKLLEGSGLGSAGDSSAEDDGSGGQVGEGVTAQAGA